MRVLLVEDHALARDLLTAIVEDALTAPEVQVAADGVEGLAAAQAAQFDLIVTDQLMPCLNGLELIAALRAGKCEAKIICISAFPEVRARALAAGADAFCDKLQLATLARTIKRLFPGHTRHDTDR